MRLTNQQIAQIMYDARDSMGHGGDPLIQGRAIERAVLEKVADRIASMVQLDGSDPYAPEAGIEIVLKALAKDIRSQARAEGASEKKPCGVSADIKCSHDEEPEAGGGRCSNCGEAGPHFVPPGPLGESGFYSCKRKEHEE